MAQFDVYRYAPRGAGFIFVVNVQSRLLDGLPLYPAKGNEPILRLNPIVEIEGERYFLAIQELSAIRTKVLGLKVASLEERRAEIIAAIDLLITGI